MAGHLVSGLSKGAEASLTAFCHFIRYSDCFFTFLIRKENTIMIMQLVTNFIVSGAFAVFFEVPLKSLFQCYLVGMVGRLLHTLLVNHNIDSIPATLIASFFIAVISQIFAKTYKTPIIIFSVSGIILWFLED
jgi:Na+-transporting NADH:ubiquinone oxidoreductase subunit NqrB